MHTTYATTLSNFIASGGANCFSDSNWVSQWFFINSLQWSQMQFKSRLSVTRLDSFVPLTLAVWNRHIFTQRQTMAASVYPAAAMKSTFPFFPSLFPTPWHYLKLITVIWQFQLMRWSWYMHLLIIGKKCLNYNTERKQLFLYLLTIIISTTI